MATIDLGPPQPTPHDLLDGLPRRVALTLPELRFAAGRANGAPLPFDVHEPTAAADGGLDDRLGRSRGGDEQQAYADALDRLHDPATSLSRRGLLVGAPEDGVVDEGIIGAIGLLATPTVAIDLDVAAGGVQVKSWHRQNGGAVAALSTQDGIVFELAWFPTWAWAAELARAAVVPEDLPLHDSVVPDRLDLPARPGRRRRRGGPHPPHRPRRRAGGQPLRRGHRRRRPRAARRRGHQRADRPGHRGARPAARAGGRRLRRRAHRRGRRGVDAGRRRMAGAARPPRRRDELRLEVARAIPEDLAAELAPVLAEVSR